MQSVRMRVSYGDHPDQVADIVLPADVPGRAPLVLLLHGGFWRARHDRRHLGVVADALAGRGYVVANVEYRRVGGGGGWPTTFLDVALAVDTLPGLIERALPGRVDQDRIVYVGHSAGGHLAIWATLRDRLPASAPGAAPATPSGGTATPSGGTATPSGGTAAPSGGTVASPKVAGVVALAPVCDLAEAYRRGAGEGAVAEFLGGGPDEVPDRYAAADPAVLGAPAVPVVIVHGDQDVRVPVAMARQYRATFGVTLVEPPGAGHFDLVDPQSPAWRYVQDAIDAMIRASL